MMRKGQGYYKYQSNKGTNANQGRRSQKGPTPRKEISNGINAKEEDHKGINAKEGDHKRGPTPTKEGDHNKGLILLITSIDPTNAKLTCD
jgi:hypothetical protein